jgi:hypothetical protein
VKRKFAFVGETTTVDINQKMFNAKTGKENISFQDNDENMLRYLFLFVLVMYFRKLFFSNMCEEQILFDMWEEIKHYHRENIK